MENRYYIYVYLDPRKPGKYYYEGLDFCFLYEPFYIGRGCEDRYLDHLTEVLKNYKTSNKIKHGKIRNILKQNLSPFIIILESELSREYCNLKEIEYIRSIGRIDLKNGPLSNLTSGGDGGMLDMSPKLREFFSKKFSGSGNPMFGVSRFGSENPFFLKKHSIESKNKISIKNRGRIPWNKGIDYDAVSGEKNKKVKNYKIISPTGDIFEIKSCYLEDFCKEHNISSRNMKRYKNKGKIPPYKKDRILPLRINTTGWELIVN